MGRMCACKSLITRLIRSQINSPFFLRLHLACGPNRESASRFCLFYVLWVECEIARTFPMNNDISNGLKAVWLYNRHSSCIILLLTVFFSLLQISCDHKQWPMQHVRHITSFSLFSFDQRTIFYLINQQIC